MSFLYDPEEWRTVASLVRAGQEEDALQILRLRDIRADSQFQLIDEKFYAPALVQGANSVTYSALAIEGLRIGPWVNLNVAVEATAGSGGTGAITLSLPSQLPARTIAHRPIGTFMFWDASADDNYIGAAVTGVLSNVLVYGSQDEGAFDTISGTIAIASGDRISMSVQYLVDPAAL